MWRRTIKSAPDPKRISSAPKCDDNKKINAFDDEWEVEMADKTRSDSDAARVKRGTGSAKTKRKQPFVQFRAMGAQVYEEEDGEVAL